MPFWNDGILTFGAERSSLRADEGKTILISGAARSGTSMIARLLAGAGVPFGDAYDDTVFEDLIFAELLLNGDLQGLATLIEVRNKQFSTWALKRPHFHEYGGRLVPLFRRPRVILTFRDPIAIGVRNVISEALEPWSSMQRAAADTADTLAFARRLNCPVMLLSYEKAIGDPTLLARRLTDFCGISVSEQQIDGLAALVEPERPAYVRAATRTFEGHVDGVVRNQLCGWAWQRGYPGSIALTLLRDDEEVATFTADQFRGDLADLGVNSGCHGFAVSLEGLGFQSSSRISVRVAGRQVLLPNSGRAVSQYLS